MNDVRMTNKVLEIKPCPFCGGSARYAVGCSQKKVLFFYVRCNVCNARGRSFSEGQAQPNNAMDEAVKAWNRRIAEDENKTKVIEKLMIRKKSAACANVCDESETVSGETVSNDDDIEPHEDNECYNTVVA